MKLNHGSLFSGIGGFDLAAEWMGWENIFHCEWNEFGQKILKYYWPNAISYEDITKTDFSIHRGNIDILTGGFPCQPYSVAGKRKGKEDERHLWPEMLRAIREIQPGYVVGENVSGLINWDGGLVFNEVQTDLENEGYQVQPVLLPACGKNAPHKRERIWFVAYDSDTGNESLQSKGKNGISKFETATNTPSKGRKERKQTKGQQDETENRTRMEFRTERLCSNGITTDSQSPNKQRNRICKIPQEKKIRGRSFVQNGFENFPTQSPICSGNDGFPSGLDGITFPKWRNESIKAYGNAVVPQVAFEIFKAIQMTEQSK